VRVSVVQNITMAAITTHARNEQILVCLFPRPHLLFIDGRLRQSFAPEEGLARSSFQSETLMLWVMAACLKIWRKTIPHRHFGPADAYLMRKALIFLGRWWPSASLSCVHHTHTRVCVVFPLRLSFNGAARNKTAGRLSLPGLTHFRSKINYAGQ
jgi:hypothetical protein